MRDSRNIAIFSLSRLISELGTSVFRFALSLYILDLTGSASMFALVLSFTYIPGIFVNIFAGVFVDRSNKKRIMVITDLLSGISILLLMFMFQFFHDSIMLFIVYAMVLSTLQAFFMLAVNASVPNIVATEKVAAVNSSNQGIGALISILGPVIGAVAYSKFGLEKIFLLDGVSFILSGFLNMLLIFTVRKDHTVEQKRYLDSLKDVYHYIKQRAAIKYLLTIFVIINFIIGPALSLILPFIVYQALKMSPEQLSYIEAALATGVIVGALLVSVPKINRFVTNKIFILIQLQALMIILWMFPKWPIIDTNVHIVLMVGYMIVLAFTGVFNTMGNIPMLSYVQIYIPEHMRASILGVVSTVTTIAVPVGMWVYGATLEVFDWSYITVISGVGLLIVGIIAHRNRELREFFSQTIEPETIRTPGVREVDI
ncbi:MFS transporter [Paenibacillus sp. IHBB 10380]|uniref:MFS transporter n=1 Tax=Paenibacillus sp. IHBB 10380 TaxID=1566358 RepID=UPI0005CF9655|nr:MFS transporter [Paenibacillus sp. IHBB 10380]AJS57349.1 arabinose ABC transporter permease [Paenibacillus sp. IHBB 10380]